MPSFVLAETLVIITLLVLFMVSVYCVVIYRRIAPKFKPMLFFVWLFFVQHLVENSLEAGVIIPFYLKKTFWVLEVLVVYWQVHRLEIIGNWHRIIGYLFGLVILVSTIEIFKSQPSPGIPWTRAAGCFWITLISIELVNWTLIHYPADPTKSPTFFFGIALIFFYTFNGLGFMIDKVARNHFTLEGAEMLLYVFYFYTSLSIITSLVIFKSLLCIPRKEQFSIS